jgi:uncharacterized protein YecE (DUF72 family)
MGDSVAETRLCIGTSGWNYSHWRGVFYPPTLPQGSWLHHYAGFFSTVEINNSFYHLPRGETFRNWKERVPDDFLFSVKASRYITHMKKLRDPQESIEKFFRNASLLAHKLGPILFQLPPRWRVNPLRLESFLDVLPAGHRYAFEFRDESWFCDAVYRILSRYVSAFCIYELGGVASPRRITADFVYVRLHGPGGPYQGRYDTRALSRWAQALSSWLKNGSDAYCYFDNDDSGYAVQNARELIAMVR